MEANIRAPYRDLDMSLHYSNRETRQTFRYAWRRETYSDLDILRFKQLILTKALKFLQTCRRIGSGNTTEKLMGIAIVENTVGKDEDGRSEGQKDRAERLADQPRRMLWSIRDKDRVTNIPARLR